MISVDKYSVSETVYVTKMILSEVGIVYQLIVNSNRYVDSNSCHSGLQVSFEQERIICCSLKVFLQVFTLYTHVELHRYRAGSQVYP